MARRVGATVVAGAATVVDGAATGGVRGDEAREIVRLVTFLIFYLLHLSMVYVGKLH